MVLPRDEDKRVQADGVSGKGFGFGWMEGLTLDRVLVVGGFAAIVLAVIIFASTDPSLVGPLLLLLLPGIVATGLLLWRPRRGFYLIAGLANSLPAMSAIPFGLFGALANPLLGPIYNAVVLSVLSVILALPAGVLGYLRGRPRFPQRPLAEGIRSLQGFAVVAVVALSVGAMIAGSVAYQNLATPSASRPPDYDFTGVQNVSILASNSRFTPNVFNLTASVVTRITILNEDDALHTFTYTNNGTAFSHDLLPSTTTRFFVFFSGLGTIPFRSVNAGDSAMNGTITIVAP